MQTKATLKPNILYVDDNETNLVLFEATFQNDYNVFLANSGEKGLEILSEDKFAVIISDQRMPGMTGNELLQTVQEKFPDVMRFILTAYTDYDTVVETINKGQIYGFFNKPFDPETVKMALNKAIEVFNLRQANKQIMKDIARANRELREIDKSKTRFLSKIINEIRTPINKIMSAIHVLKDKMGTNELVELLNYLDISVSRLESFSNAASQLARLNEENLPFHFDNISLKESVELCIIENKNSLDETGIKVELTEKEKDIKVNGESELLVQCLTSILVNSIIHTESNGTIRISIGKKEEFGYVEIIDQGSGYTKNQVDELVSFFSNNGGSINYNMGLEMILAKQIMMSHNGNVVMVHNDDNSISTRIIFPN
jgi:signal transduction histidine kinase